MLPCIPAMMPAARLASMQFQSFAVAIRISVNFIQHLLTSVSTNQTLKAGQFSEKYEDMVKHPEIVQNSVKHPKTVQNTA